MNLANLTLADLERLAQSAWAAGRTTRDPREQFKLFRSAALVDQEIRSRTSDALPPSEGG
jgi:hypothetical protein